MKTFKLTSATSLLRKGSYESPETKVSEIITEGILCVSGQFEFYEEEDLIW